MRTPADPGPGREPFTDWLMARLDDTEHLARAYLAAKTPAGHDGHGLRGQWAYVHLLADVAAKRRLLTEHPSALDRTGWDAEEMVCGTCGYDSRLNTYLWPCPTLRLTALPFAGDPGYRPEWGMEWSPT
jgi:hypothetical protein